VSPWRIRKWGIWWPVSERFVTRYIRRHPNLERAAFALLERLTKEKEADES